MPQFGRSDPLEPLLRVEGITKRFRGVAALNGVGFSVRAGERNNTPPNPDLFPENNTVLRPPVAGKVGLWSKTDSTSYFKDYVVVTK